MKGAAGHGIGLRSTSLRWARLKCVVLGHEEWRDVEGSWFCMRCLKTNDLELNWVRDRFDADAPQEALIHAFRTAIRNRSRQIATDRSAAKREPAQHDTR